MQVKRTISGSEPVAVSDAKTYLKIDFSDEDALIGTLITGIRENIENFTGLALVEQTIIYFDEDIEEEILLPYPEHDAITEVAINGTATTDYIKTGINQFLIRPSIQYSSNTSADDYGIKITYTTTGDCKQAIKNEILKSLDEKYRNRGNTFEGSISDLSENTYSNLAKFCIV